MTSTTVTSTPPTDFRMVGLDLYRDIHKGIRAELFALVSSSASLDPADGAGRCALAAHVRDTYEVLEMHAEHEDVTIQPHLESELLHLAEQVAADHVDFEARFAGIADLATAAAEAAVADQRRLVHLLHLDLAAFTGSYLAHQDLEERQIMPALEAAIGFEAVLGIHQQIIESIPPDVMARSLAFMLPAMNVDDRTELLGGMQAGAPAEVFDGVWSLAGSVLERADLAALGARLGR